MATKNLILSHCALTRSRPHFRLRKKWRERDEELNNNSIFTPLNRILDYIHEKEKHLRFHFESIFFINYFQLRAKSWSGQVHYSFHRGLTCAPFIEASTLFYDRFVWPSGSESEVFQASRSLLHFDILGRANARSRSDLYISFRSKLMKLVPCPTVSKYCLHFYRVSISQLFWPHYVLFFLSKIILEYLLH